VSGIRKALQSTGASVPRRKPKVKVNPVAVLVASGMVLLGILFMSGFLTAGGYPYLSCLATPRGAYSGDNPPRYTNMYQGQVFVWTPVPTYYPGIAERSSATYKLVTSFDTADSASTVQQWYLCVMRREGWDSRIEAGGSKLILLHYGGGQPTQILIETRRVDNVLTHVDIIVP
jgi:hypothetical protein